MKVWFGCPGTVGPGKLGIRFWVAPGPVQAAIAKAGINSDGFSTSKDDLALPRVPAKKVDRPSENPENSRLSLRRLSEQRSVIR